MIELDGAFLNHSYKTNPETSIVNYVSLIMILVCSCTIVLFLTYFYFSAWKMYKKTLKQFISPKDDSQKKQLSCFKKQFAFFEFLTFIFTFFIIGTTIYFSVKCTQIQNLIAEDLESNKDIRLLKIDLINDVNFFSYLIFISLVNVSGSLILFLYKILFLKKNFLDFYSTEKIVFLFFIKVLSVGYFVFLYLLFSDLFLLVDLQKKQISDLINGLSNPKDKKNRNKEKDSLKNEYVLS